jgi:hypothetical protein
MKSLHHSKYQKIASATKKPPNMDSLLNALTTFSVSPNKSQELFNDLLSKVEQLTTHDPDEEWGTLSLNFSKLKYIDYLITNFDFPESEAFTEYLTSFLKEIDKKNQYYIDTLNFESDSSIQHEGKMIKCIFENSFGMENPLEKLKSILKAYSILVEIIEEIREEHYTEIVDDDEFIEETESFKRKRK